MRARVRFVPSSLPFILKDGSNFMFVFSADIDALFY